MRTGNLCVTVVVRLRFTLQMKVRANSELMTNRRMINLPSVTPFGSNKIIVDPKSNVNSVIASPTT